MFKKISSNFIFFFKKLITLSAGNEMYFLLKMRKNVHPVVIILLAKEHFKITNH